jgi:hypothetical protein
VGPVPHRGADRRGNSALYTHLCVLHSPRRAWPVLNSVLMASRTWEAPGWGSIRVTLTPSPIVVAPFDSVAAVSEPWDPIGGVS